MSVAEQTSTPTSAQEAAAALRAAADERRSVRLRGAGTKLDWGRPTGEYDLHLSSAGLDAIVEHNEGDLTAILQAGVPLAAAQAAFAAAGQMLAWDPPLGPGDAATIGGVVATADTGPMRHRYLAVRDLVLGVQVALPDGSVARAGGKVIKNVAGYDLAKLFSGSFGTLGLITEVSVRLHPRPTATATAVGRGDQPGALAAAASALAHHPLEHLALDLAWGAGHGAVLARFAGPTTAEQAGRAVRALTDAGLDVEIAEDDDDIWARQRAGQRATERTVVRVATTQTGLAAVLEAARRHGARVVARAAVGTAWLTLPEQEPADAAAAVGELRATLAGASCVVLDAPVAVREAIDPWGDIGAGLRDLSARVKRRFDPYGTCNHGLFVGGL